MQNNFPFVTSENYYDKNIAQIYMGSTQFKQFSSCEAGALALLRGDWAEEKTQALLIGSYVDAHFAGTLDLFRAKNPEIYKKDGNLKAEYEHANYIIQRIERDAVMMDYLSGEAQKVMVGEIEGVPVKVRIDFYHRARGLLTSRSCGRLRMFGWRATERSRLYRLGLRHSGGTLSGDRASEPWPVCRAASVFIAAATKEKPSRTSHLLNLARCDRQCDDDCAQRYCTFDNLKLASTSRSGASGATTAGQPWY
jgi:hypothetical protein